MDQGGWFRADGSVKSGIVIMVAFFKLDALSGATRSSARAWARFSLLQHCALKSKKEACVEGYGSIIERHASKLRGNQNQENYASEGFIHINGPLVHQADDLVERALNLNFGADKDGLPKPWHFCNTPASLINNANALEGVERAVQGDEAVERHSVEGVLH